VCPMKKGGVYIKCVYIKPFGFNLYHLSFCGIEVYSPPPLPCLTGSGGNVGRVGGRGRETSISSIFCIFVYDHHLLSQIKLLVRARN